MRRKLNEAELTDFKIVKGNLWKEELSVMTRIPFDRIRSRLLKGDEPTELEMDALCRALGKAKDVLFPVCETGKITA
jgi:hypothetical protein